MGDLASITIRAENIEVFRELYLATHAMLLARLMHGQDSREFFEAINRVIDAHDVIAIGGER